VGKARKENDGEKRVGAGERQPLFPRSCSFYFRVPFLIFVPSLLSESLEQASCVDILLYRVKSIWVGATWSNLVEGGGHMVPLS